MSRLRAVAGSMLATLLVVTGACVERESAVAPSAAGDTPSSIPELGNFVVEANVPVPMRDGVVLRADVYRPSGAGRHPVLLMRTPYGKDDVIAAGDEPTVLRGARSGYAVVVQDVRGRYHSDGNFNPYRNEGRDGYDSIEWAAAQPWSNGRVGTLGLSYPGAVQWLAAMEAPPHLVSMSPAMTFASARHFFYYGGAFNHDWMRWILNYIAPEERRRRDLKDGPRSEKEAEAIWAKRKWDLERFLPIGDLPELREVAPWYREWLEHPDDGDAWAFADVTAAYPRVGVPVLHLTGWHDSNYGPIGATTNFTGMRERGATPESRQAQRLVIGPWDHGDPGIGETRVGELDFGTNAPIDYYGLVLRWHDRWLKGIRNGIDETPPVRLFVMGENVWRDEDEWPLERAVQTPYYLRSSGDAATGKGGGHLAAEPPPATETADRYVYDPRDPVVLENFEVMGPRDRSALETRRDLLVYSTAPLEADVEVTGPVTAHLWVASSAVDTDFMVMLLDVHPDGRAYNVMPIEAGIMRARYRESQSAPRLLTPDEPVELVIGDMVTSNLFRRGHRIRVHVTSSRFPVFDRNLNTGEAPANATRMVTARQTVLHDAAHPSRILLPVVPRH
ncbi:MAG TPA: CocE/NonD family hydrolase [Candidatus Polarisedimenticolia bacterium]|nr:CocE/NonD family hydrolase [Candidatus Polarisedimenticolia bacterium]